MATFERDGVVLVDSVIRTIWEGPMKLTVNGEPWVIHFTHVNVGEAATSTIKPDRRTTADFHRGDCVLERDGAGRMDCKRLVTVRGVFVFPTRVFRRRAVLVHGNPVAVRDRWTMSLARETGRRGAFTRAVRALHPSRGPGDDRTARAAFWEAYWVAVDEANMRSARAEAAASRRKAGRA